MVGSIIELNKMESMVSNWTEWPDSESLCLMSKIASEHQVYFLSKDYINSLYFVHVSYKWKPWKENRSLS